MMVEILKGLEYINSCGYLHRDIKPDNFMMGRSDTNMLYIIDFGLSKNYLDNTIHITQLECKTRVNLNS